MQSETEGGPHLAFHTAGLVGREGAGELSDALILADEK